MVVVVDVQHGNLIERGARWANVRPIFRAIRPSAEGDVPCKE